MLFSSCHKKAKIALLLICVCCIRTNAHEATLQKLMTQAQHAYQTGKFAHAVKIYENAAKLAPENDEVLYRLGIALLKVQQIARGFQLMEKAVLLRASFERHYQIADLADSHRLWKKAAHHYRACLQYRNQAIIYRKLAMVIEQTGDIATASRYRSKSVAMEVPLIRELQLKNKIEIGLKTREQLQQFLLKELAKELPDEKANEIESSLYAFGFTKKKLDIRKLYIRLLTEQVAGFYNPETKRLYLIEEVKKPGFWSRLFQTKRDDSEERMIMAHEMVHALQDQYFDLGKLDKLVKNNDDRAMAFQALVEGDATLAMLEYHLWPKRLDAAQRPMLRMAFAFEKLLMPFFGGKEFASAPKVIRESLIFPYIEGLMFCLAIRGKDPWKNINRAFRHLPESTEQILHPQKYLRGEIPVDLVLPDLAKLIGKNWQQIANNVMGELMCLYLLEEYRTLKAKDIAAGWGGDRYSVLQNQNGNLAIIWLTIWDSTQDAQEFFVAYSDILRKKYKNYNIADKPLQLVLQSKQQVSRIYRHGRKVYIMEKIPQTAANAVWKKLAVVAANWK